MADLVIEIVCERCGEKLEAEWIVDNGVVKLSVFLCKECEECAGNGFCNLNWQRSLHSGILIRNRGGLWNNRRMFFTVLRVLFCG